MNKKLTLLLVALALLTGYTLGSGNVYHGAGQIGISWDRGGVDNYGIYLCPASYDARTQTSTHYKIPEILQPLIVDC